MSEYEDDNIGVQAVQETTKAVESTAYTVDHAVYSHKLKSYDKAEKLVEKSDKANVNALYEKFKKDNPDAASNPISRWKQKQAIKKEYAAAKAGKGTAKETAAKATKKAAQSTKMIMKAKRPKNLRSKKKFPKKSRRNRCCRLPRTAT